MSQGEGQERPPDQGIVVPDTDDDPQTREIHRELIERLAISVEEHRGPLPPPAMLEGYEKVLPGAAERIVKMAEEQASHRRELERTVVHGGAQRANQGLWLGFVISLVVLGLGAVMVFTGHETAGITLMGLNLASLAGVFVYGRIDQRRERTRKQQQAPPLS